MCWTRRALDGLYAIGAILGAICLIAIVGLVVAQVAARWLAAPLAGAPELAGYAMANSFCLPLAYAFRSGAHIRISLLIDRLKDGRHWIAELVCLGVGLGLASCLAVFMCRLAQVSYMIHEISQGADATPLWIPQAGMAVGSVLLAVALADTLVEHLFALRRQSADGPGGLKSAFSGKS